MKTTLACVAWVALPFVLALLKHWPLFLCRPEICYGPPQIAGNSATHVTLSQVLQQIDHHLDQY